ncbi:phosphate/phosphite/phosphonate ABC transporter substrate-binding protein [Duganella aceris]|uniref:PhnD/SsuA/transferrin family substrate-binding protein n=1 Tax=Duganella aceris TaxID=2703883 RepID=A0ABX0FNU4_9BURK|nr:PhnD/SsuA/transferrin family substrate-binding protein [Duganella aceris]NGZ86289.1 PhnD/SsuA/transferrin family substrate-binding protein [Duganella aceris]
MIWKVALPMYNLSPRLQQAWEGLLGDLLDNLDLHAEVELVRAPPLPEFWLRPDLLLSQTCGYPYMTLLREQVTLIATPAFDFPGCSGSDYSSVIVAPAGAGIASLADARGGIAAVNDAHSNSGMNALRLAVAPLAREGRFFDKVVYSGSHAASLRLVREGDADIAAIDCVTYGYLKEEDPVSLLGIKELGYSATSPGLPLVAGKAVPPQLLARLRSGLTEPGPQVAGHMRDLRILAFHHRPDADYRRIIQLEAEACAAGYPLLA